MPIPCSALFITGTDTEVGKTFVTCALLHALRQRGIAALGMKPIAAGCDIHGQNADVEAILAASSISAPRELVNPYLFQEFIAPHIAAAQHQQRIEFPVIFDAFNRLRRLAEMLIVEGVGGFCVPLGPEQDTADLAEQLALPVLLVVGMRLGCINHALLTQQAIAAKGLRLVGWVANRIDPGLSHFAENLATLQSRLKTPLLGVIPAHSNPEKAASLLSLNSLILPPKRTPPESVVG